MDLDTIFKCENVDLLFKSETASGNYIAEANDRFSEYMERQEICREWAMNFPAGRYVIIVFQRYSVFIEGKKIWQNNDYLNEVGKYSRYKSPCFVIALDRELDYMVPSWGRPLRSHILMNEKNSLQARVFQSVEKAELVAEEYSKKGFKVAVLEWFEDFDMY